ncbi:MAG: aspartate/glutamate racemase family protein [Pseudomonadota bacterium]
MRTQVALITPVVTAGIRTLDDVRPLERPDLSVTHSLLDAGPASIESEFDEALCVPDTVRKAMDAERAGAHAIVIDCMGDPGLGACREAVRIPVLGPCQVSLHVAATLGHRVGFVTVLDRIRPLIDRLVAAYGLRDSYASFRAVDVPVRHLGSDRAGLQAALAREALAAVRDDGADVLVLGCTGFLGCAGAMREALLEQGLDVPVVDPIPLTIHVADALVRSGLAHSGRTYPPPGRKARKGYSFPEFLPAP